jgi:hypothetical protein
MITDEALPDILDLLAHTEARLDLAFTAMKR